MDTLEQSVLQAGPLTLRYEDGGLRYVRYGDREVVRRVYCAVRDANWGTAPLAITNLRSENGDRSFQIEFDATHQRGDIDFRWHGTIIGEAAGRVVFEMDGVAHRTFRKNRLGFCILHPMELAGLTTTLYHADGSIEHSEFPRFIAAHNPFLDVAGMEHDLGGGARLKLTFEGEVFETEDQRNWIDASYKTFCTPLSRPFPVDVKAGERIWQRVTMGLVGQADTHVAAAADDQPVTLELAPRPCGPLPQIGFVFAADAQPLTPREIDRLKPLLPAYLRVDLRLSENYEPALQRAILAARELECRLDLAMYVGLEPQRELAAVLELVRRHEAPVARWTVFPSTGWCTTRELALVAREVLSRFDSTLPIGGGTPANFRELNAQRPPVDLLDFVTWSMNPQVHAFDEASMVETLAAHAATVESARQFIGNVPVVVGPVTLKMQTNPYATGPWPPPIPPGELPIDVDPRQASLFAAGWTLGSIKYLAESGAVAATYYELVGWKGLMERAAGSPLPEKFPSIPGAVFPLYHVFADLAEFAGAQVVPIRSSQPLQVEALGLSLGQLTAILVTNLTARPQQVTIPHSAPFVGTRMLDEANLELATTQPEAFRQEVPWATVNREGRIDLNLAAYALARVVIT